MHTDVEVIFDYMCPGSKGKISGDNYATNFIDALTESYLEDETSYMDAILLKMAPFPYDMHAHVHEVDQVLPYL